MTVKDLEKGPLQHEKRSQQQHVTRKICPSNYHDKVIKPKLCHRPWLESLDQFMDPDAEGFALDLANNDRMEHFDIKVIHIPKSGAPLSVIKCRSREEFEAASCEDKERAGALVIAKGLSREMIEALGSRFELEPEFFAQHLKGTELYRTGQQTPESKTRMPNLLPDYVRRAPFYTAEYRRPFYNESALSNIIQLRRTITTTPRGVHAMHVDLPDVFVAEQISVYKRNGSNIGRSCRQRLRSMLVVRVRELIFYATQRHHSYRSAAM